MEAWTVEILLKAPVGHREDRDDHEEKQREPLERNDCFAPFLALYLRYRG